MSLERLGGAFLVILALFIVIPFILSLDAVRNSNDLVSVFSVFMSIILMFIGAIVYIFREKRF